MKKDKYLTLFEGGEGVIIEKKSRFIATVEPVETVEEAEAFIEKIKKSIGMHDITVMLLPWEWICR